MTVLPVSEAARLTTPTVLAGISAFPVALFPLCVPLGEKSLQDIYDQVDNKAGYALLVITDKQLKASDYKFIDQIPVGILPESALNTIKDALGKYKEADYFDVKFETRSDLLFPAKPIVGKQWMGVDEVVGTGRIRDPTCL